MKATRYIILAAVFSLVLSAGCDTLQNVQQPTATLKGVELADISPESASLLFDMEISNPYSTDLPMVNVDYDVTSNGGELFAGKADIAGIVPANSTKIISLPVKIDYFDVADAFKGISPGSKISCQADVGLSVNSPALGIIRLPMNGIGQLAVPVIPERNDIEKFVYTYSIDGLSVQTGDLICTTSGNHENISGQLWQLVGKVIPGDVDHIAVYVGPGGRCVEEGGKLCAAEFEVKNNTWDAAKMTDQRGHFIDSFYGVIYPLAGRQISHKEEMKIRADVAVFCLKQVKAHKLYNFNYLNSKTDTAFYCSQLAYKAYLRNGIDLNTGKGINEIPGTKNIILPQEIWNGCEHKKAGQTATDNILKKN